MRREWAIVSVGIAAAVLGCSGRGLTGRTQGMPVVDASAPDVSLEAASDVSPEVLALATPPDYANFVALFSALYCHRLFTCCTVEDRTLIAGAVDEETCTRLESEAALGPGLALLDENVVRYDLAGATTCLDDLRAVACGRVLEPKRGIFFACQKVLAGTQPIGADCEGDVVCESRHCTFAGCQPQVAPRCPPTMFVDGTTGRCVARLAAGGACATTTDCQDTLACLGGVCAAPRTDGLECQEPEDCTGSCGAAHGNEHPVCRPGFCQGR